METCPVCGDACNVIYINAYGAPKGCDACLREVIAETYYELCNERDEEYE